MNGMGYDIQLCVVLTTNNVLAVTYNSQGTGESGHYENYDLSRVHKVTSTSFSIDKAVSDWLEMPQKCRLSDWAGVGRRTSTPSCVQAVGLDKELTKHFSFTSEVDVWQ